MRPCLTIAFTLALLAIIPTDFAAAQGDPLRGALLAHFRFNGNANDESGKRAVAELRNTEFRENALFLNGKYDLEDKAGGYVARFRTPALDYGNFSVAVRFKATDFQGTHSNVLTGGPTHRWFSVGRALNTGHLTISLNSGRFKHEIPAVKLEAGKWTVLACGMNLKEGQIVVYVNGKQVEVIKLPADFALTVATSNARDTQKVWTFTNSSNASTFHGLVDELIVYNRMLTEKEFESVPLKP